MMVSSTLARLLAPFSSICLNTTMLQVTQENMTSAEGAWYLQSLKGSVITASLAVPSRQGQAPTLRDILALKENHACHLQM